MPHLECTKMHHNTPNAPRFDAPMMHPSWAKTSKFAQFRGLRARHAPKCTILHHFFDFFRCTGQIVTFYTYIC